MIADYLKLLGLKSDANLNDVKKAYRKLAKEHHPDRFTNEGQKKKQEKIMSRINEAYNVVIEGFDHPESAIKPKPEFSGNEAKKEVKNDYSWYKKGIEFFNKSYEGILEKMEQHNNQDKEDNLRKAKASFEKILQEYPDSDWVYDSEEKIKKIDKMLKNIPINTANNKTNILPKKDPAFYAQRFKDMFRK